MWQEVASSPAFHAAFPWLIVVLGTAGYAAVFALLRETAGASVDGLPARPAPPPPPAAVRVGQLSRTVAYAVEADAEGARLEHAQLILTVDPSLVGPVAGDGIGDATGDAPGDAEAGGPPALRARLFGHVPHAPDSGRGETPLKAAAQPAPPLERAEHVSVQVRRPERLDLVGLAMATVEEAAPSRLDGRYVALEFTESDARDLCASLGLDPATALGRLAPAP